MNDALAPLDRRTLGFWRISNLVGWAAVGLAVAFGIHWVAAEYSDRYFQQAWLNAKSEWFTGWSVLPAWGYRLGVSLVIGLAVGTIVGKNAWKRPASIAAIVGFAYALIAILAITFYPGPVATYRAGPPQVLVTQATYAHGFGGYEASGWIHDALTLATVAASAGTARLVARGRP